MITCTATGGIRRHESKFFMEKNRMDEFHIGMVAMFRKPIRNSLASSAKDTLTVIPPKVYEALEEANSRPQDQLEGEQQGKPRNQRIRQCKYSRQNPGFHRAEAPRS